MEMAGRQRKKEIIQVLKIKIHGLTFLIEVECLKVAHVKEILLTLHSTFDIA